MTRRPSAFWSISDRRACISRRYASPMRSTCRLSACGLRPATSAAGSAARSTTYPEYIACAYAAYKLGRTVRWCATRSESFVSDIQARDHMTKGAMAFDSDGKIIGLRVHGRCNMGAHIGPRQPASTVGNVIRMLVGAYAVPAAHLDFKGYVSNTVPINVYRGVGRLEDIYLVERLMDLAALRFGVDRAEIRRRNLVKPSAMPFTTPTGEIYDCGDFPRLMESALRYADWAGFPDTEGGGCEARTATRYWRHLRHRRCGRHGAGVRRCRGEARRDDRGRHRRAVAGPRPRDHVRAARRRDDGHAVRQGPHHRRRYRQDRARLGYVCIALDDQGRGRGVRRDAASDRRGPQPCLGVS